MPESKDLHYLKDIQVSAERVISYTSGMDFEQFDLDHKTQDAVVRNLEIIGEATKNLSPEVRKAYPDIPWKDMAGMRDVMIHQYFGVNNEIVWTISKDELPHLLKNIDIILSSGE